MEKKFDLKSSKVKGLAFHKTRLNWVGIGTFTGEVQIWDFRNGFMVSDFSENDSCIRCVDFHVMQSLIISGGDDNKVRGWDYATNKKAFELEGHVDFVRAVQFHKELPWILSCSDDQTIRIWNWQSKQQLSVITGHGHYILTCKFHKTKDLMVSGSLDSTLRIWDFSKLKSRFSSTHGTIYMLSNDVEPFIITEAHVKGINWVDFHPNQDMVATCSDDHLIKLWRYTKSNAYEQQVFHGHSNNVSCVVFSDCGEYLFSNGEDCQFIQWDLKGNQIQKMQTGQERQWVISLHSTLPLVALGCQESLKLITIQPEQLLQQKRGNFTIYYSNNDNNIKMSDLINHTSKGFDFGFKSDLKDKQYANYLTVNQFGKINKLEGFFKIEQYLKFFSIRLKDLHSYHKNFNAKSAVFVSPSKFITLENDQINLYEINNFTFKNQIKVFEVPEQIYPGLFDQFMYRSNDKLIMFDLKTNKKLFQVQCEEIKKLISLQWNEKRNFCYLQHKSGIIMINKKGDILFQKKIDYHIKSIIWDENDKIVYNTHEHINYILVDGECGIIRSIDKIIFLTHIKQNKIIYLNINEELEEIEIDKLEIDFKCALLNKNMEKIKELVQQEFLGQSIVSFLLKKKYNDITMKLTKDKNTAFYLALHSDKLQKAFVIARELNEQKKYKVLAETATRSGAFGLAECCYKLTKQNGKLMHHYIITGNQKALNELKFEDVNYKFNQTLLNGNIKERVKILAETGQVVLAYACAKTHGLVDFEKALEEAIPDLKSKLVLPKNPVLLIPPLPLVGDYEKSQKIMQNWPIQELEEDLGEKDELSQDMDLSEDDEYNETLYKKTQTGLKYSKPKQLEQKEIQINEVEEDAWGVDNDLDLSDISNEGDDRRDQIKRDSKIAWEHFVIQDIQGGMKLLQNQIGLKNQENINNYIEELSNMGQGIIGEDLPNKYNINYLKDQYNSILEFASQGKLKQSLETISILIKDLIFVKVCDQQELDFIQNLKLKLLNYKIAFSAKIKNDMEKNLERKTELCLIMSMSNLESAHSLLILKIAINNLYKIGCFEFAGFVAKKYLGIYQNFENLQKQQNVKKMNKILNSCLKKGKNKFSFDVQENDLEFEEWFKRIDGKDLVICDREDVGYCCFDGMGFQKNLIGELCYFCEVCQIGYQGEGIVHNQ